MIDLASAASVVRDPLFITLLSLCLGGLLAYLLFPRNAVTRAIVKVIFLAVLTVALLREGVAPYEPLRPSGVPLDDAVRATLKIAWWFWTAWFLVGLLRAFVVVERRPREGKLIQDLLAGAIYLAALFAVVGYVFDQPIRGLLATSGAVAIILGLALQSTLSDVFSGIVLNFSRPYRPGDWISVEGATDGRVIEINWRATHILTAKRDLAILPNSAIAKAKIVNASSPSGIHGMSVAVRLAGGASPAAGAEILGQAILNTRPILSNPAPSVRVEAIAADAVSFDLGFFVEELAHATPAQNELFDRISRHLAAAGIALAASGTEPAEIAAPAPSAARRAVDLVEMFADLTENERAILAGRAQCAHYEEGAVLVKPEEVSHSLLIVGAGVVSVRRTLAVGEIEQLRLGPGDHFGEIGLLTGECAEASLTTLTPVTVYELTKDDLAPLCEARPEIAGELSRALARRREAGQLVAPPDLDKSVPGSRTASWLSGRLHALFDLARAA